MKNDIVIYQTNKGEIKLKVDFRPDTIWATQEQIASLFGVQRPAITKHINNIYLTKELDEKMVCSKMEHTTPHGAIKDKTQTKKVKVFNLDMILSIGYRVNSTKATEFRKWSNTVLKNYLLQGVAINQERLNQLNKVLEIVSRSEIAEVLGIANVLQHCPLEFSMYNRGSL